MSMLDLSALPAPQVLETLDFEALYQGKLATFRRYMGDNWTANLESDPVTKQLELSAYGDMLLRARVNDAAKALLLAHAQGTDLDQLAANVNLQRLVIQAGDLQAVPPVAQVKEADDALRERVQLAYEGLTTAGPRNSYILHARNASARVADAEAESPSPACVTVTVMSLEGDGAAAPELLATVAAALNDEDVRPLGDRVTVNSAQILPYRIDAVLHMKGPGPESDAALAEAERKLAAWVNPRRRLGIEVARSAIDAQLHVAGVARVELRGWQDIVPSKAQAAYCTGYSVTLGS
ncbi:phage-related baseplate assembly protein [Pseudomonas protegens]|jgi:phage-related baseplate assembly protein|uniref:baseplate assembly protein n=1 Tax=Pseudomonas TaxID=286 RepID=UPI00069F75B3|nr:MULTISPECIES: baseplate J/gp47 family protein [Pseudomonas]MBB1616304.1 baseplate assembly protein [Pseudomonas sp. UMC65]MBB1618894.1 baseplate assembly protein [Pseudomonas sp. UME65]MCS4261060.1 phage-related baseplate assembly protein [Pseudomonas sp. BIGb0176]MDF4207598.1 baseplate J/gp47 family protein [Pseudomonas protegens]MDX9680689.1 baseplate J/gp47 family protein [Pseudomonas protegens]